MELMSKIGDYLLNWRTEKGLNRAEAAKEIFVNPETLRKWELGISDPTYSMIKTIHEQTGADWEDLF